jgi:uncharacterized protein
MTLTTVAAAFTRPGAFLVENTAGVKDPDIASHSTIYMVGSSSLGDFHDPTQITSIEDFTNQFGASPSEDSVRSLFREYEQANVYFCRAGIADTAEISVIATTAGTVSFTINGASVNVTVDPGSTAAEIAGDILATINTTTATAAIATAYATPDPTKVKVVSDVPGATLAIVESSNNISVTDQSPTSPTATDFIQAIEKSFDADDGWQQGFLIAPEAFQSLPLASDRLAVGNAMDLLVRSEGFDWVGLVDNHPSVTSSAQLNTDSAQYVSAIGHIAYFAPYLVTFEDTTIPASAVVAASAAKKYSQAGFQEPIGGTKYKLSSVKDVAVKYNNQQQNQLNPLGINLVRNLKRKGVCIWGMRSKASDISYRFIHTRVIMNVVNGSLRNAFDDFPFSSVDGIGLRLHLIEQRAHSLGIRLWQGGAFFGGSPEEAFAAVCNFKNNTPEQLETGLGILQFFCAPVPGLERLVVGTYRVKIGQVQSSVDQLV